MPNYGGSRTVVATSGGVDLSAAGNGFLVKHGTQVTTVELEGIPGLHVRHKAGQEGNPLFEVESWLGRQFHMDLTKAGSQAIHLRAALFIPRRIVITMARGVPTTIKAAFHTAPVAGRGELIWDVPASEWAKLTDDLQVIEYVVPTARRSNDYLNLIVETPNNAPLRVSVFVYGDTLISSDVRGRAF